MKNLVYGDSSWLTGDSAADAILAYAVLMAKNATADSVDVVALGPDGNEETTTLVLSPRRCCGHSSAAPRHCNPYVRSASVRNVDGMSDDKNYTDVPGNPPDTASGGAPEDPDDTTDPDGTPVENPSG